MQHPAVTRVAHRPAGPAVGGEAGERGTGGGELLSPLAAAPPPASFAPLSSSDAASGDAPSCN